MAANGQKLRVAVTKTSAQGKAAQSATPNLMSFSSDENSIWFNGKKYGVYILKGFENLSTDSNTGVIQSFLGDFTYDRWVDAVNTGNIVFVETNNILIPASVYANNSEDLNIMFVTLTYTYFVSIHYSTGSGYSINLIQQDSLVRVADVNNTLTNSSTDKPLSAAMGKKLQDEKLGKTDASNTYATKSELSSHTDNTNNPHGVTKEQVGLSNVTNDAQVKRSEVGKAGGVATLDSGGKVPSAQLPSYVDDVLEVRDFVGGKANIPTSGLTVGWLYYVTGEKKIYRATSATAVDGGSTPETGKIYVTADDNKTYRWSGSDLVEISKSIGLGETAGTAYDGKKGADLKKAYDAHAGNTSNPHGVTKEQVGLSNVTNDAQVKRSEVGKAGGVATLDSGGKVPSAQLPSYVDDVLEVRDFVGGKANIPTSGLTVGWLYYVTGEKKIYRATSATAVDGGSTPETGKIYVTADDNKTYRWSGSDLVEISKSIGLGETAGTAYDGKKGADLKKAYDAHAGNTSNPHGVTKEQVGLSNVTNDAQVKRSEVVDDYDAAKIGSANEVPSTNAFKKAAEYAEMFPVSFDAIETGTKTITQASATTPGGRVVWLDDMKKFAYKLNGSYYNNWSIPDSPNPALTNADLVKVLGTNGPIPGKCYITNGTLFFSTGSDLAYVANFTELSNSLSDSSTSKALTAAKGKQLQDEKLSKTDANNTYAKKADGISNYSIGELTALSSNPTQEQLKEALGTPSAFRNAIDAGKLILVNGRANVQSQKSAICTILDSGNVLVKYLHPDNNDWTVTANCVPASSGDNWDNAQFSTKIIKPSDSAGITIE